MIDILIAKQFYRRHLRIISFLEKKTRFEQWELTFFLYHHGYPVGEVSGYECKTGCHKDDSAVQNQNRL